MTISKKMIISFAIVIVLFAALFALSMLSERGISAEGDAISEKLVTSQEVFGDFQEISGFSDKIGAMLLTVLKLGYAKDIETEESLMNQFNESFSEIETKAKELGVYELLIEDFNNIRGQVDAVYINKIDAIDSSITLAELRNDLSDLDHKVQLNKMDKENILKVTSFKLKDFQKVYMGMNEEFGGKKEAADDTFDQIRTRLLKDAYLEDFRLLEIEELWTEEILGMGVDLNNFMALILNTRQLIMDPKDADEYIKEAVRIKENIGKFVDLQYDFGLLNSVVAVFMKQSVSLYIEEMKLLNEYLIEEKRIQQDLDYINDEIMYTELSKTFADDMALEIINVEVDESIANIEIKLDNLIQQNGDRFNVSISEAKDASAKSIKIISGNNQNLLYIVLISIVLSVVIVIFIRRSIRKSMKSLTDKTDRVQELDLSVEFAEKIKNDELGTAEQALKEIVHSMKSTLINVKASMASVQGTTTELETISEESRQISDDLKQISDRTDQNVQDTSAAIEEVSSGIEEVAASAKNVSDISRELYEQTSQTTESAKTGEQELTKVTEIVKEAEVQASETSKYVESLQEQAKYVGEIVGTISSISEQTNLLALNAAIEAARAGEAGKGFAVVADEIRKLAEESKKATEDIGNRLKEIGNGVQSVNTASDKTLDIVNNMNDTAQSAMAQFNQISANLMAVLESVENLSNTAEEQSAAADEIAGAMDQSAQSMVHAASQVELMVNQVEKQMHSVEVLNDSTEHLARLADELNEEIDKFTV